MSDNIDLTRVIQIQKLSLDISDRLIVTVDCEKMSPSTAKKYMSQLVELFKQEFPNNRVIVMPHKVSLSVLESEVVSLASK